jgi:beta-1,4-mannosyl-glycoprotein beta-1,4-N-acetylglucosaminyltransferase
MAIYDCFQYFNEEHIADLRFNILNEFVNYFVIVESTVNHQGKEKKLQFDINKFSKFKKKIRYIIVDDTPQNIRKPHEGGESLVEQHQRNSLMKVINKADDNDLIILSDVDEIPNLKKLNLFNSENYAVFSQKMFMYKINLLNINENNWHGSKICLKKNLKSPQWLRNLKFKKYPFWRIDKPRNIQIIENGGWHFAYLQSAENISKKIKSFAHGEFNKKHLADEEKIKARIEKGEDVFERGFEIKKVEIDNTFPNYIKQNQDKLKNWIV